MWAEVSSSAPHLLHKGLLVNPIKWRCLLRVIISAKKANNNPGLCPIEGQKSGLCSQTWACVWLLLRPCHLAKCWLTIQHFIFLLIFCFNPQGRLRSNKLLKRLISCKLVGDFISLYSSMSSDPVQPHSVQGRNIIQCLLAPSFQLHLNKYDTYLYSTWDTTIIISLVLIKL